MDYFRHKKITLMGLGLLGRGVGDAVFMARAGAELIVTDLRPASELKPSLRRLARFKNVTFRLGGHNLADFQGRDFILRGAAVPPDSPYLAAARRNGVPVYMSTALFAKFSSARIIGVTGTKGKTTVSYLLNGILKQAGIRVWLGGNVPGVSTLALLPKVKKGDWVVLELDSWQLNGLGELGFSPAVAVFTNFLPDHLNYYRGDLKKYLADKAQIFLHQTPADFLILGQQAAQVVLPAYQDQIRSKIIIARTNNLPTGRRLKLPGEHNRQNAAAALAAAKILGIKEAVSRRVIKNFTGVPGRLELVRVWRGIKFYNDTAATTPEATMAALAALGARGPVILILGGADKDLNYQNLVKLLPQHCRAVFLLPGSGSERLLREYPIVVRLVYPVSSLRQAVIGATKLAKRGEIVLLSPAFASFGLFKNEYDRGRQFNRLIGSVDKYLT